MQFQPVRARITRDGAGESLHDVPGMIPGEPEVGSPFQMFLESGKVMRTSNVRRVAHGDSELVVETENSLYRLKIDNAA